MYGLIIEHRTLPGKRDALRKTWDALMQPAIAANPDHISYAYSFGQDADVVIAFQAYSSQTAAQAFLNHPSYLEFLARSRPYLAGDPKITQLDVQWLKPAA